MGSTVNGKHLNIDLDFNANTSKAKKEIQELQKQLSDVIKVSTQSTGTGNSDLDKKIRDASSAALELKKHLSEATNVNTGKLDLSSFQKSLKTAGKDLSYFRKTIAESGPEGRRAFSTLADSIMRAEVPLRKTNALLQEFGVTLKNTARWQISSSILHGFMGSIQTAYHYAEDLNRSLNNIRIVTGQNTDQMAAFAKQANESAKALSTTTTKYTDAALIYYQQGLSDKEVKERTDVTVKMANVARESAEEVSNQMTAVWNNFKKDGSEAAESFADKMTALGAATASSTSEIAEGLSKFAGIADTIGLSFDYASSALATVTATSRESADVVGTAFKTIFARMEGLKQGQTDEDGTDLNKYSQGLAKIGVQIKDQNGELKSMDTILEDMGKKWQGLSRDQKIATAQTVAGVRQYNQLMTLMDNWDFFQKNLATAQNSEGTLQEQADIYAESWEAARDRVTAAAEEIYSQLLNDDFFIDLNNVFAGFLGIISDAIDGLGGLKGVLLGISTLVTKVFGKEIAASISNIFSTNKSRMEAWKNMQDKALDEKAAMTKDSDFIQTNTAYEGLKNTNDDFMEKVRKKELTVDQQEVIKDELEIQKERIKNLELLEEEEKEAKKVATEQSKRAKAAEEKVDKKSRHRENVRTGIDHLNGVDINKLKEAEIAYESFASKQKNITDGARENSSAFKQLVDSLGGNIEMAKKYAGAIEQETNALKEFDNEQEKSLYLEEQADAKEANTKGAKKQVDEGQKDIDAKIADPSKIETPAKTFSDKAVAMTQAVTAFGMALSTVSGLVESFSGVLDGSVSAGDFFISFLTSVGMVIPAVMSGINALKVAFGSLTAAVPILAVITGGVIALTGIISLVSDAWNADANAAEKASKAAEGLKNRYEELKTANEELKQSFDEYNSAKKALKEMTIGTEEWKQAVIELNDQVLELMDKYPELIDKVKNVNGVLELSSDAQQTVLDNQTKKIEEMRKASVVGKISANQAQEKSKLTDFRRDELKVKEWTSSMDEVENYSDALNKVVDAYEQNGNAIFSNTESLVRATGIEEEFAKVLLKTDNRKELIKLTEELGNTRKENEMLSQDIIKDILKDKNISSDTTNSKFFQRGVSTFYEEFLKEANEKWEDSFFGITNDADAQKKYMEINDYKDYKDLGDNKGKYLKADGTWTEEIDDSVARTAAAAAEAEENLSKNMDKLAKHFKILSDSMAKNIPGGDKETGDNLLSFLQGSLNYDDLTKEQAEKLSSIKLSEKKPEELLKSLGLDPDQVDWEQMRNKLKSLPKDMDWKGVTENLSNYAKEAFSKIDVSGLTRGAQVAIGKTLDDAFYKGGRETVDKISALYEEANKNGKAKEFSETLKNIDWNNTDLKNLKDQLSQAGINTKGMDKALQDLINTMQSAEGRMENFKQIYGDAHKIMDGLESGSIISDDDYTKLEAASAETSKYFTTMLDGTHKLTGDAQDFYKTVQNDLIKEAKAQVEDLEEKGQALSNVKNYKENPNVKVGANNLEAHYDFVTLSQSQFGQIDSPNKYKAQLDIVKALGDTSEETQKKIRNLEDALNHVDTEHPFKPEQAEELAKEVSKCKDAYDNLDEAIEQNNIQINQQKLAIAMTAKDLDELNSMLKEGAINQMAYAKAMDEMHDSERMEDIDSEEITEYGKHLQDLAKSEKVAHLGSVELSSDLQDNAEAAKDIAIQIARMNGAVETLADNWEDWSSILKKSSRGSQEYFKASVGVQKALADLFDVSEDYISLDLVDKFAEDEEAMKLMAKAAEGDGEAIDKLREKAQDDIIAKIRLDSNIDKDAFDNLMNSPEIQKLKDQVISMKVGAELDDQELINALNSMAEAAGLTETQINNILSGIGYTANFASDNETVEAQIPITTTRHFVTNRTPVMGQRYNGSTLETVQIGEEWEETEEVKTITSTEKTTLPVWGMQAAPPGTKVTPKINSISKKPNGSVNNYSKANAGGKGPGKKGRGKNGGGGKGNKNQKVQPKQYQDEFDMFGELNHAMKDLDHTLNKLGKEYDYTFGKERIENLEKQNKAIQQQAAYVKQLTKAQQKEQKRLIGSEKKDKKGKKVKTGLKYFGGKFDKDGELLNYTSMTTKEWKRWEKARKKYNKSARTDKDKKVFDKADKRYEEFKKRLDDYEKIHEQIQEDLEKEQELTRQLIENNFERWKLKLEVELDTRKTERDWKKFLNKATSSFKKFGKQFGNTFVEDTKANLKAIQSHNKDLDALIDKRAQLASISTKKGYKEYASKTKEKDRIASSASEAKEKMKELDEQIQQSYEDLTELVNESWQNLLDRLNQTQEEFDLLNEQLERQGDILEFNKQLIELQYGDKAYQHMEEYYKTEHQYLKARESDLMIEQEFWKDQFVQAEAAAIARGEDVNREDVHTWTQDMYLAYKNMNQAAGELEQTQLQVVQNAQDLYTATVDNAIYQAQMDMYGMSFDDYVDQWERAKEIQDRYLDDTEKIYHIETLMNKIDQQIASTKNEKNIARLKKFREEELKNLSKQAKLTKYQVDAANARYEIALKEMALEEAKNNKNSMKLTRNQEGNWSYQYVANMDDILKKQQELRDAQNNYYELAKQEKRNQEEESMNAMRNYWEKTREAALLCMTDQAEGQKKLDLAIKQLNEDLEYTSTMIGTAETDKKTAGLAMAVTEVKQKPDDVNKINPNQTDLANQTISVFGTNTSISDIYTLFGGYGQDAADAFVKGFSGGDDPENSVFEKIKTEAAKTFTDGDTSFVGVIKDMATQVKTYLDGEGGLTNIFKTLNSVIDPRGENSALSQYTNVVSGYFDKVSSSIAAVGKAIGEHQGKVQKVSEDSENDTKKLRDTIAKIKKAWKEATDKVKVYKEKVKKIKGKTITIKVKYKEIGKPSNIGSVADPGGGNNGGGGGGGGSNKTKTGGTKKTTLKAAGYKKVSEPYGVSTNAALASPSGSYIWIDTKKNFKSHADKYAKQKGYQKSGFRTGGYTGDWPQGKNDGKLAFLHQKELVLNKEDTKNMLAAVDTIRDIKNLNSSIADTISNSISNIFANTIQNLLTGVSNIGQQEKGDTYTIENITAEFPNAQDVDDIREAILSLPRLASQYMGRNLK